MSEEIKIKISQPMFEVGELERFDKNINSIVEEYSKLMFKEKDQILTQRIIMKQEQEIERLQKDLTYYQEYSADLLNKNNTFENIIKEVREYIEERYNGEVLTHTFDKCNVGELLNILKGVDKE